MASHVVQQGECFDSIAERYGIVDAAGLFDHPDNAELKKHRKRRNVLAPGDVVAIPDRDEVWVTCATAQRHDFKLKIAKSKLRIALRDGAGEPIANRRYVLRVDGLADVEGTTDGGGLVEQEVPRSVMEAELLVWREIPGVTWPARFPVRVGHLDPIELDAGVQHRLHNLGYRCEATGQLDAGTRAALAAFQAKQGLPATGDLDDATRGALLDAHGGF